VGLGFDLSVCGAQLEALKGASFTAAPHATITAPGQVWIDNILARVDWLLTAIATYPQCLDDSQRMASMGDQLLATIANMNTAPADIDATTRSARASRRSAIRVARDLIHSKLFERLRLSDLCDQARLKVRSLENGFKEVTGLTPIAYIRSLRLNAARRALEHDSRDQQRTISEIAMDTGFWHLSQFAADYRSLFGETPRDTRRRATPNATDQ